MKRTSALRLQEDILNEEVIYMKMPKMVLFDYGQTLISDRNTQYNVYTLSL